jgi:tRNA modification GTPase
MAIVVADTAGLRQQSSDPIEQEGMRRSGLAMESADILVWLSAVDVDEKARPYRRPDLRVFNKVDLLEPSRAPESDPGAFPVSLLTGEGLDACKVALLDLIRERNSLAEDAVVVRERHRGAVLRALTLLRPIQTSPQSDLELVAENMRNAAQELAGVTGRIDAEDVLGQIFQDFCIGK